MWQRIQKLQQSQQQHVWLLLQHSLNQGPAAHHNRKTCQRASLQLAQQQQQQAGRPRLQMSPLVEVPGRQVLQAQRQQAVWGPLLQLPRPTRPLLCLSHGALSSRAPLWDNSLQQQTLLWQHIMLAWSQQQQQQRQQRVRPSSPLPEAAAAAALAALPNHCLKSSRQQLLLRQMMALLITLRGNSRSSKSSSSKAVGLKLPSSPYWTVPGTGSSAHLRHVLSHHSSSSSRCMHPRRCLQGALLGHC